jgi:hypothetical protein
MKLQDRTESTTKNDGMAKQNGGIAGDLSLGAGKIPADLAARSEAAIKSMLLKKPDTRIEQQIQRAKLKGRSSIAVDDLANRETHDASVRLHESAASMKVPFPKVEPTNGLGFYVISGTWVAPFDFAFEIPGVFFEGPLGNPATSGSASQDGQISASVGTGVSSGLNAGREYAIVGSYFRAPEPGLLRVRALPAYSFEWRIYERSEDIFDFGSISLAIGNIYGEAEFADNPSDVFVEDFQTVYSGKATGSEGKSGVQIPLSTSMEVNAGQLYSCFMYLNVGAMAYFPPSSAWSMLSAAVPSISYEFVSRIVIPIDGPGRQ